MTQSAIQPSFHAGEWAPNLYARVDLAKYHAGLALCRNFFVDYRGGVSTRTGTKYILQAYKSSKAVRLISFQASFQVGYIVELGDFYARFYNQGAPVLESAATITGISKANPAVVTMQSAGVLSVVQGAGTVTASYAPGNTITLTGGTFSTAAVLTVNTTKVVSATVNAGGSGGTNGTQTVTGTTGTGTKFQASVTVSGGAITAVLSITVAGSYTVNPTTPGQEPVTGASLTGAKLAVILGPLTQTVTTPGVYTVLPSNPVAQGSTSGSGAGANWTLTFSPIGATGTFYAANDWIYITGVVGMTDVNGKYYNIGSVSGLTLTLQDLNSVNINSTAFGTYTSGGTTSRVYTLTTPWAAADLATLRFTQTVNQMIFCHNSYTPYILTLSGPTSWTLAAITFGSTVSTPGALTVTTSIGAGTQFYAYCVTAVDASGQESGPSPNGTLSSKLTFATSGADYIKITWAAVTGAQSYNVYKALPTSANAIPSGALFGLVAGGITGVEYDESSNSPYGVAPDFTQTPPITSSSISGGSGVISITITNPGSYPPSGSSSAIPTCTIGAAPAGGLNAIGNAVMSVVGTPTVTGGCNSAVVGDVYTGNNGQRYIVASVSGTTVTAFQPVTFPGSSGGSISTGFVFSFASVTNTRNGNAGSVSNFWGVSSVNITSTGAGYSSAPTVTFGSGTATGTAVLGAANTPTGPLSNGYPAVPIFFQQRLVLMGQAQAVQSFVMSQPGSYYNFNASSPIQSDNAIAGSLVSGQLNTIKAAVAMPPGLVTLSDKAAWLINAGSSNDAVTPSNITANQHAFNGICDIPPIQANDHVLYVQSKGSNVRDLSYDFYRNVFTGTDISVLSNHLFFGYTMVGWAWAEEPFKIAWLVRNDGVLLSLTYLKEQELIGWAHHDTNGSFKSVATIVEVVTEAAVDATYFVVQRTVNGNVVQYIERMADRFLEGGYTTAWCVDAALQYNGSAATVFSGLDHLIGMTVTGLADGAVIPPTVVSATGTVTLGAAATLVTIGLAFTPQFQTLPLDLGDPTVQGKRKKITAVDVRVADTLGLQIGKLTTTTVAMKDLVVGNLGTMSNAVVSGLVTGDARTIIDPYWDPFGQFYITQPNPYPATILGVIPEFALGDTDGKR